MTGRRDDRMSGRMRRRGHGWALGLLAWFLVAACAAAPQKPCDLMKMLQSLAPATVQKGIAGFVAMGEKGAVPLVCYMGGKAAACPRPTAAGKLNAERALVRIGSDALSAAQDELGSKNEELRVRLVRVLGQITDIRREAPLKRRWEVERSDRVRAALVATMTTLKTLKTKPAKQGLARLQRMR